MSQAGDYAAVFVYFFSPGIWAVPLGGGTCGHMQKHHLAADEYGQLLDVIDDRPIGRGGLQSHQDVFVHAITL
jgi:hypothetical protein